MKLSRLSQLSAFGRPEAHLTNQTVHGAVVTLLGALLATTLCIHEVSWFLTAKHATKMSVDLARRHDLDIRMDISFPAIPCAALSVDVLDVSGTSESDMQLSSHSAMQLHKIRLNDQGKSVRRLEGLSEYHTPHTTDVVSDGSEVLHTIDMNAAIRHADEMSEEVASHEGCRVHGNVRVRRVAGKVLFSVHQNSMMDLLPQLLSGHMVPRLTNMSHVIHKMAFGPEFPGQVNPLDGFSRIVPDEAHSKAYKYYLKIVPTNYFTRLGMVLETSQYSVGEYQLDLVQPGMAGRATAQHPQQGGSDTHAHGASTSMPYVAMLYDLSPIIVTIDQSPATLLHFLVRLCAVVGGAVALTGLLDKAVHALMVGAGYVAQRSSGGGGSSMVSGAGMMSGSGMASGGGMGGMAGGGIRPGSAAGDFRPRSAAGSYMPGSFQPAM